MASIIENMITKVTGIPLRPKHESSGASQIEAIERRIFPASGVKTRVHDVIGNAELVTIGGNYSGNENDKDPNNLNRLYIELYRSTETKKELSDKLDSIRNYDYVETILRDLSGEVLTRSYDPTHSEFFIFNTDLEEYSELNEKVNSDLKNLKIYDILADILEDFLLKGQYILKMDYSNDELDDGLDQDTTLPAYTKSKMVRIFDAEHRILRDPANYLVLNLFSSHKKLKIKSESGSFYYLKLPRGVIPESIIAKINNLKILEALQPLIELQAIDEKMYFHVQFPPGKDATEAYKECRTYEKLLKSMLSLGKADNADQVIEKISTIKVIPLFGNQQEMRAVSVNKINRIDLEQIKDLRNAISNAIKIKIDGDNSTNSEYYKLVKTIRNCLRISVQEFLIHYIHQKYSIKIKPDDFELKVPEVQGAEDLDMIDYLNMNQSTYKDTLELLKTTVDQVRALMGNPLIDEDELLNNLSDKLQKMTGVKVFRNSADLKEFIENPDNKDVVAAFNSGNNEEES